VTLAGRSGSGPQKIDDGERDIFSKEGKRCHKLMRSENMQISTILSPLALKDVGKSRSGQETCITGWDSSMICQLSVVQSAH
jgi:hypothetical protein